MKKYFGIGFALMATVGTAALFQHAARADKVADEEWASDIAAKTDEADYIDMDTQEACAAHILQALNKHFKTEFTLDNVVGWPDDGGTVAMGYVRGGAFNIRVQSTHLTVQQYNRLKPGRTPLSKLSYVDLGIGRTLHVPNDALGVQLFHKEINNDVLDDGEVDGAYTADFVAHIDSAYPYLPIGGLIHLFRDVIGSRSRPLCP